MMAAGMEGGTNMANGIVDFIPVGRENAISRKRLTELCVENDLIDTNKKRQRQRNEIAPSEGKNRLHDSQ